MINATTNEKSRRIWFDFIPPAFAQCQSFGPLRAAVKVAAILSPAQRTKFRIRKLLRSSQDSMNRIVVS